MDFDFDLNDYENQELPAGDYLVVIAAAESKQTKAGDEALQLTYQVLDGEYKGRRHYDFLNLFHHKPNAREIARVTLNRIAKALRMEDTLRDSDELLNKMMVIRIAHERDKSTDEVRARIKKYLPKDAVKKPATVVRAPAEETAETW